MKTLQQIFLEFVPRETLCSVAFEAMVCPGMGCLVNP